MIPYEVRRVLEDMISMGEMTKSHAQIFKEMYPDSVSEVEKIVQELTFQTQFTPKQVKDYLDWELTESRIGYLNWLTEGNFTPGQITRDIREFISRGVSAEDSIELMKIRQSLRINGKPTVDYDTQMRLYPMFSGAKAFGDFIIFFRQNEKTIYDVLDLKGPIHERRPNGLNTMVLTYLDNKCDPEATMKNFMENTKKD